jgi:hypothetical protein
MHLHREISAALVSTLLVRALPLYRIWTSRPVRANLRVYPLSTSSREVR